MAKQIKVIKCPQCGSVKNTLLKPDYYKCNSCATEYFLDSDDVNINHHYPSSPTTTDTGSPVVKLVSKIFVGLLLVYLLFTFAFAFFSKSSSRLATSAENKDRWNDAEVSFFESNKKAVFITVGIKESGHSQSPSSVYVGFYDAQSGKNIKMDELGIKEKDADVTYQRFDNGDFYFIVNKKRLYKVDQQSLTAKEVSPDTYNTVPDLQTGFAKIEFYYKGYGDAFNLVSNAGKELYYYPAIQKTYTYHEMCKAQNEVQKDPSNTPVITRFKFSTKSSDYENEKIQLIQYKQKAPVGVPVNRPFFCWTKDYGSYGLHNGDDQPQKTLMQDYYKKTGRVISYKDFTPDRLYFDPTVLDFNDKLVLITYKPTPAENEHYLVQLLNASTAQIIWTLPLELTYQPQDGRITNSGYFVKAGSSNYFIGPNGKIITEYNYR